VGWGDRKVDEMGRAWVTCMNDEDFQAEVAKRRAAAFSPFSSSPFLSLPLSPLILDIDSFVWTV
jgi:hypothetical protein